MKKFLFSLLTVVMSVALNAQQYPVYADKTGLLKPLPNGVPVSAGSATNATTITVTDNNALNFTVYPVWAQNVSGAQAINASSAKLSFNPLTGFLNASGFIGPLTGNATTATTLQTTRNINGVPFNGSADITVTANAGTLTGTALNSAITSAPGVTSAAIGTFGTMATQAAGSVAITGGSITGATVTGLPSPSADSDAATKLYVDNAVSAGLVVRTGVAVATAANITLSGEQTIDGVLTSASRVLVKNQTLSQNNGIYVSGVGAWSRATDSDTAGELLVGYYYFVTAGTTQGGTGWSILTAPTVLNTDPVVFAQFSSSTTYTAGTGLSLIGNAFSVNSAQSGLAITGSTYNGTVGAVTPSSIVGTTLTTTGTTLLNNLVVDSNQLNEYATNGLASVNINFDGYNGGTTQFRNTTIYDGKNNVAATFTGSTKGLAVVGPVTAPTFNGNTVTTGTGTLTLAAGKTLTASNTLNLAGTDGTTQTFPSTSAVIARTDAPNTFTGHQTIEGVTATGATGTGNMVYSNGPTFGALTASSITITNTNGTTGATNSPAVGQQLNFSPFTNGTTTTIALPSAVNGNSFMLYFQAANGLSSVTFTGASVYREGDPDAALPSGVYVPGPAGNHSALLKMVNSRWMLSDDSYQATYVADTGTTNAYVMTLVPAISAYTNGNPLYTFIAANANTGASTLNINGLGVKTIKKAAGGITTDLAANDIRTGQIVTVGYDGTNFQMVSLLGNAGGGGGGSGVTLSKTVTSAGHGLSVGTLYGMWNSTGTTWVKASASSSGLGKVSGIAQPIDANTFTLIEAGDITTTGLTAGSQYYLTDDGSGLLAQTQPSTLTSFVVPVMLAGSTTLAVVQVGPAASLAKIASGDLASSLALVTPNIGVATGTSLALTGGLTSDPGSGTTDSVLTLTARNSGTARSYTVTEAAATGSVTHNVATGSTHIFSVNGSSVGNIGAFGLNSMAIGASIPSTAQFTNITYPTASAERTVKGNLKVNLNAKDYGAVGDGVTDDTTAITAYISALPASGGYLYFPAGTYKFNPSTAGLSSLASKTKLTIYGDGIGTSTLLSSTGSQVINLAASCSYVEIYGLTINGGCTARKTGSQAFASTAAFTNIHDVEIRQSGEFACYIYSTTDVQVSRVSIVNCYADGINVNGCTRVNISDCFVVGADDDCYAIPGCTDVVITGGIGKARAYGECLNAGVVGGNDYIPYFTYNNTTTTAPATGTFRMNSTTLSAVTLVWINDTDAGAVTATSSVSFLTTGNILLIQDNFNRPNTYARYTVTGAATHTGAYTIVPVTFLDSAGSLTNGFQCSVAPASMWGRGLWFAGSTNVLVNGLSIDTVKQSGIRTEINGATRNTRTHLKNMRVRNSSASVGGGGHGTWLSAMDDSSLENCSIEDIYAGSLIVAADWNNFTISGNTLTQTRNQFCRGFDVDGTTTPTAWNGLKIINNSFSLQGASTNESIRMAPNAAITITNTAIVGNVSSQASTGDYIYTDYTAAPTKIVLNVSQEGRAISNGGHGTAPTATPNY